MVKIGFFGTPEISAYVLKELYDAGFEISWVVTQPDRKAGRGLKLSPPPVKLKAQELGLKVFQSEKFDRELYDSVMLHPVDLSVVIAYGSYIPTYFINSSDLNPLNIHVSLLPKYRGAAPVARAIMNGDDVSGVTIMKVVKEMDAGDIVAQKQVEISQQDNVDTLTWKLVKEGVKLLVSVIPSYLNSSIKVVKQSETGITPSYAEKILAKDKVINWTKKAKEIHDQVRALYPWPVAEAKINDIDIKITKTSLVSYHSDAEAGEIVDISRKNGTMTVSTNEGVLLVEKVQPFGKREMQVSEFINGYKIEKGMRFKNV